MRNEKLTEALAERQSIIVRMDGDPYKEDFMTMYSFKTPTVLSKTQSLVTLSSAHMTAASIKTKSQTRKMMLDQVDEKIQRNEDQYFKKLKARNEREVSQNLENELVRQDKMEL